MKCLLFAIVIGFACVSYGAVGQQLSLTPEEKEARRAAAMQRLMEKAGGIVELAGKGSVAIVDGQSKISAETISKEVKYFRDVIRVGFKEVSSASLKEGARFDVTNVKMPEGAAAVVYIVDDVDLPLSLVAVESRWGLVNVSKIDNDIRFKKEFQRVVTMTFGAGVSQFKGSPMQPVFDVRDLDKVSPDGITFDALTQIRKNLESLDVTQGKKATFKKACLDGWAPKPTNEWQRAIWSEINKEPSKPIQIKYDKKKGI